MLGPKRCSNGSLIHTGGKVVKNVVGYDLTHLLVGSEGTLGIITKVILRLIPKPPVQAALRATFSSVAAAVNAVSEVIRARVIPAALEIIDEDSLDAVSHFLGGGALAPVGTGALLLIEVDGLAEQVSEEANRVAQACRIAGATEVLRAGSEAERQELWRVRRELSPSLRVISPLKFNTTSWCRRPGCLNCSIRGRDSRRFPLRIPCFGRWRRQHPRAIGVARGTAAIARAHEAERVLFEGVVRLEGSISGEHGIGFAKAAFLGLELSAETIAIMRAVKAAFDPHGILNPGKVF